MIGPEEVEQKFEVAVVVVKSVESSQVTRVNACPVLGHDLAEFRHVRDQQPQEVVDVAE